MKAPESAVIDVTDLPAPVRGLAVVSFSMNFFGMLVFWWFPFGMCLAVAGSTLGAIAIALGVRTKERGLYYPLGGMALAALVTIPAGLFASKLAHLLFFEF